MNPKIFKYLLLSSLVVLLSTPIVAFSNSAPWDPFFATPTTAASFADLGANPRPYGIVAGIFDNDSNIDLVIGRALGQVYFVKGNGDGTFQTRTQYSWKQAALNVWAVAAGDVNGDNILDVIWGATATSTGCTVPVGSGQTCLGNGGTDVTPVNDGEVRAFLGVGDGTFSENPYYVTTVLHNAGVLLADVGVDAASLAVGDVDGDNDTDIIVGAIDGTNAVIKLLRNSAGVFSIETILSVPAGTNGVEPIYFSPTSAAIVSSPWGLALGDVDGDGDLDLWVGDRALYIYLYLNNGAGVFTLQPPASPPLPTRPNVLLAHDSYRAAVGYTTALASNDLNGDGKADLVMGLQSGTQTSPVAHDGEILLHSSTMDDYIYSGTTILADIGMVARGISVLHVNGDAYLDIMAGEYAGMIAYLRQLPPLDTDGDGISDYVDNAPTIANAPRLDMNTDGSKTHLDQLDNDFDTVLGNPEDPGSWYRMGDPIDPDDDNDSVLDTEDNCPFVPNPGQEDIDQDGWGDACDPLVDQDTDGDGVLDGPLPGDPLYAESLGAAIKWSQGETHFVIRIDALSRWFQNEFTQIMTDAAILSPADWAVKCWQNYDPEDFEPDYEPCGTGEGTLDQTLTLEGGKQMPVSLAVIPKQLWTDPPVITWIDDRNNYDELEIAQHGSYHANNTPNGDWASDPTRNIYSCETCGLSEAENFELLRVGYNTLVGNYADKWVTESGATVASPAIDWLTSVNPLISYSPPYNASDTLSRQALAQLGYKSFSASRFEEEAGFLGWAFSPEGSHMEQFDQFGMFHASADLQVDPPTTPGDIYNRVPYQVYLQSITQEGGLNTWLIEEVEWSGRPNNTAPRDEGNRENNTVYLPRWEAWLDLLDFVKNYPDSVAMTLGDVALAKGFDNAPTVDNPDQADSDHNGIGDVIDGAKLAAPDQVLFRNNAGSLTCTLTNGLDQPIPGQTIHFKFDADGDGNDETYMALTNQNGTASVTVTATRPTGTTTYQVEWDGLRLMANQTGNVDIYAVFYFPIIFR